MLPFRDCLSCSIDFDAVGGGGRRGAAGIFLLFFIKEKSCFAGKIEKL